MKWTEETGSLWQPGDQTQDLSWPVNLEELFLPWMLLIMLCACACHNSACVFVCTSCLSDISLPPLQAPSGGLHLFTSSLTWPLTLKSVRKRGFLSVFVSLSLMDWNNGIKLLLSHDSGFLSDTRDKVIRFDSACGASHFWMLPQCVLEHCSVDLDLLNIRKQQVHSALNSLYIHVFPLWWIRSRLRAGFFSPLLDIIYNI